MHRAVNSQAGPPKAGQHDENMISKKGRGGKAAAKKAMKSLEGGDDSDEDMVGSCVVSVCVVALMQYILGRDSHCESQANGNVLQQPVSLPPSVATKQPGSRDRLSYEAASPCFLSLACITSCVHIVCEQFLSPSPRTVLTPIQMSMCFDSSVTQRSGKDR